MKKTLTIILVVLFLAIPVSVLACEQSKGQTVYVPATHNWAVTDGVRIEGGMTRVLIRNINLTQTIRLLSVDYYFYNASGDPPVDQEYNFLVEAITIAPLTAVSYDVRNAEGFPPAVQEHPGRPCVIVKWASDRPTCPPIIEGARIVYVSDDLGETWDVRALAITPGSIIEESKKKK